MENMGLPEGHIQNHHDQEAGHNAEGASMGFVIVAEIGLWNELLHHYIEHGSGSKGEQPGHQRLHGPRSQNGEQCSDGLYNT